MQQQTHSAIRYLPAPLPLKPKQPLNPRSLLPYSKFSSPPQPLPVQLPSTHLQNPSEPVLSGRRVVHQIGQSIVELFRRPVYQVHDGLTLTNNEIFATTRTDQNCQLQASYHPSGVQSAIQFDSRFECGNLALASQAEPASRQYYLAVQRDINSKSQSTQWFYFKVSNSNSIGTFTFHIVNYTKPFSLFKIGMRPCVCSTKSGKGWERDGHSIMHRRNSLPIDEERQYYTISFSYDFTHQDDQVYFAYCYPYSYSRLMRFLDKAQNKHNDKLRRKTLAKTLGGNVVQMVSITNPNYSNKKIMFLTARVHPGETVSSYACEGLIQHLLSPHPEAEKMRAQFIIKIVPMLNPDGVINGNYRTSLSGDDLNRHWKTPSKLNHPQVYYAKKAILQSEYKKLLFVDIHGHSKKKSTFMYGCISSRSPYLPKQLPYVLSRKMNHFSYYSCNFAIPRCKEGTSRIALWRAGIDHSYTYQLSFCGPSRERRHFQVKDYLNIGHQLGITINSYFHSRILQQQINSTIEQYCQQFYNDGELMNLGNEETNGSSSELDDEVVKQYQPRKKEETNKIKVRNSTERNQTANKLHGLLDDYLTKKIQDRHKANQQLMKSKEFPRQPKKQPEEALFKQRQSFMATRVNLQQMQSHNHVSSSLSTFYGLGSEKESRNDRTQSMAFPKKVVPQTSKHRKSDAFGILLPNLQLKTYKRYQRQSSRQRLNVSERAGSVYMRQISRGNRIVLGRRSQIDREISLVDRTKMRDPKF